MYLFFLNILFLSYQKLVNLFTSLNTSYMITDGSLLQMYRNCSTGLSDVDFVIDLGWWRNNHVKMVGELIKGGFRMEKRFGDLSEGFGYAEAWRRSGQKVDLYSNIFDDQFSIAGLWVGIDVLPCYMRVERIVQYQWLEGVVVRGPHPIQDALISAYGHNYMYSIDKWVWDRDHFVSGYCRYQKLSFNGTSKKR